MGITNSIANTPSLCQMSRGDTPSGSVDYMSSHPSDRQGQEDQMQKNSKAGNGGGNADKGE